MNMITRSYTVRFLTPAFLGDAEQNGAWRTPPFKALLRQWWRVAYVRGREPTATLVSKMRETEGRLFGNAWLDADEDDRTAGRKTGTCRSVIRLRLEAANGGDAWTRGTQQGVAPLSSGLDTSYSWFGLIKRKDRETKSDVPDRTGIKVAGVESERALKLAIPEERVEEIDTTLRMINTFGQIGSRARTGWGAIQIDRMEPHTVDELLTFSRDYKACLDHDWAHALGRDGQGAWVWVSTHDIKDWAAALTKVAALRKEIRTFLKGQSDLRPLLGFADATRMPSPLRWRVFRAPKGDSLGVRVFALPHKIPDIAKKDSINRHAEFAWRSVTLILDSAWLSRVS